MGRVGRPLGDLEHELLNILWARGDMTAAGLRNGLVREIKDATVRTVLRRLEEKGYVTHTVIAGTFLYHAEKTAHSTAASALKETVERFCGGSFERALVILAEAALIEPAQLAAIAGKLKRKTR
jgi:BlaI family transcriptional regulator, penicillinase repressor